MTPPRVLVVDDEPAIRRILTRLLAMAGYEPVEAQNGEEALELLEATGADVVLLDLQMPGMSGQTLFHAIRSRWPALAEAVIVMSGDPEDATEWLTLHQVPVLAKPFDRTTLLHAIQHLPAPDRRRANGAD
jgi:two-component system response regulator MprA